MKVKTVELHYKKTTNDIEFTDITRQVEHSIVDSGMNDGIAIVYAKDPSTCITTMEYEPGAQKDLYDTLKKMKGKGAGDGHMDARPSMIGSSITVPFKDNREMLGKWQKVTLIDFNGNVNVKKVIVQVIGE